MASPFFHTFLLNFARNMATNTSILGQRTPLKLDERERGRNMTKYFEVFIWLMTRRSTLGDKFLQEFIGSWFQIFAHERWHYLAG